MSLLIPPVVTSPQNDESISGDLLVGFNLAFHDQAPAVAITSPPTGAEVLASGFTLLAGAFDPEEGALSGDGLVLESDVDGVVGIGAPFTGIVLTAGTHVLTVIGTDSRGQEGSASITVTAVAEASGTAPTVSIVSPADLSTIPTGEATTISATATDTTSLAYSVNGGAAQAATFNATDGTWDWAFTPAADGGYSVVAIATGAGGSTSSAARTYTAAVSGTLATDFEGYPLGADPAGWSKPWATSSTASIVDDSSTAEGKILQLTPNTTDGLGSWVLRNDGIPDSQDGAVLVKLRTDANPTSYYAGPGVVLRVVGSSSGDRYGYIVLLTAVSADGLTRRVDLRRMSAGSSSTITGTEANFSWLPNTWYWLLVQTLGADAVKVKIWADGDPEPAEWLYERTSASDRVGAKGVYMGQGKSAYGAVYGGQFGHFAATNGTDLPVVPA